jgi:hypothetical protein
LVGKKVDHAWLLGENQFAGAGQAEVVFLALMQQDHLLRTCKQVSDRKASQRRLRRR